MDLMVDELVTCPWDLGTVVSTMFSGNPPMGCWNSGVDNAFCIDNALACFQTQL